MPVIDHHAALFSNPIYSEKANVVRRELVLDARIAQPDDQLHGRYFFASGFLDSSAAGASSGTSCLPFLMTSGSAGAAAAASATASGVGATSSFTDVMWATV